MNPKISIIVSIYNTEKYIEKCIDSLLKQTYENLEIILIEDGSTDHSKNILKSYEKNQKCVVLYNEGNKGLAYSRNRGLKVSQGEFIGFIDSDDYVDEDYYEVLWNSMKDTNADVAICDMNLVYPKKNVETICKCCEGEWNIINIVNNGLAASACNKLFKADLIKKYEFATGKINEDIAVVIPTLVNAKKIVYAPCHYNYVQRENSIQNSKFSMKRFDIIEAVDTTIERIKGSKYFNELKDVLIFHQVILLLLYVIPKEKRFFYRQKVLKEFNKQTQKYNIRKNSRYWRFLDLSGKKHRLYYKVLLKFLCNGHYFMANLLITLYKLLSILLRKKSVIPKKITYNSLVELAKLQQKRKEEPIKISVVIPNYNYERFLIERLYSILKQTYKIYEIILLDDYSTDHSRDLIDTLVQDLNPYIKVSKIYNQINSGSAFKQWEKGFEIASGDYVWIAEADDYCESNLLKTLVKPIQKNKNILISYANTAFIDEKGYITMKTIIPQIDIRNTHHWDKSYVKNGLQEIKEFSYLNCTIANVSSCIIKKKDYHEYFLESGDYQQAGDWLFYLNVLKNGDVAYSKQTLNYYREHGNNVSSIMDHTKHIKEIMKIYDRINKEFSLGKEQHQEMKKRIDFLKKCWHIK